MNRQARRLVLHADDLGMSRAVNRGILLGFRDGLLTSAAILANAPEAEDAMTLWNALSADRRAGRLPSAAARRRLGEIDRPFDLGVHLNLSQGRPLGKDYPGELLDSDGRFPGATGLFFRLLRYGRKHREAITAELERQVRFVVDRGPRPTHLNGHQYVEMMPGMAPVTAQLLDQFQIPMVRVAVEPAIWRTTAPTHWPMACVKQAFARRFRAVMDARGTKHCEAFFGASHAGRVDSRRLCRYFEAAR